MTRSECKIIIADSNREKYNGVDEYIRLTKLNGRAEMKRLAIKYLFFFFGGALASIGLVGIAVGIYFICNKRESSIVLLLSSVLALVVLCAIFWLVFRKLVMPRLSVHNVEK
jgi:hypothetical protein